MVGTPMQASPDPVQHLFFPTSDLLAHQLAHYRLKAHMYNPELAPLRNHHLNINVSVAAGTLLGQLKYFTGQRAAAHRAYRRHAYLILRRHHKRGWVPLSAILCPSQTARSTVPSPGISHSHSLVTRSVPDTTRSVRSTSLVSGSKYVNVRTPSVAKFERS